MTFHTYHGAVIERPKHEAVAMDLGAKLTDAGGSLRYEGELSGEPFRIHVPAGSPGCFQIEVQGAPGWFRAIFRRASGKDLWHKRIFGSRRRTGDERFDRDVFVVSYTNASSLKALLAGSDVREASMALIERGLVVTFSLAGVLAEARGEAVELTADLVRDVVPHLLVLKRASLRALPREALPVKRLSDAPEWLREPPRALAAHAEKWVAALEMLPWLLWASGFVAIVWTPLGMDAIPAWVVCIVVTSLVAIPFAFLSRFEGRDYFDDKAGGRMTASDLLDVAGGWLMSSLLAAPIAMWLVFGLNILGAGSLVAHRTEVVAQRGGSVSSLFGSLVEVRSWRPDASEVWIPQWFGPHFAPGDPVIVWARRGLFGWEVAGRIRAAPDASIPASSQTVN